MIKTEEYNGRQYVASIDEKSGYRLKELILNKSNIKYTGTNPETHVSEILIYRISIVDDEFVVEYNSMNHVSLDKMMICIKRYELLDATLNELLQ